MPLSRIIFLLLSNLICLHFVFWGQRLIGKISHTEPILLAGTCVAKTDTFLVSVDSKYFKVFSVKQRSLITNFEHRWRRLEDTDILLDEDSYNQTYRLCFMGDEMRYKPIFVELPSGRRLSFREIDINSGFSGQSVASHESMQYYATYPTVWKGGNILRATGSVLNLTSPNGTVLNTLDIKTGISLFLDAPWNIVIIVTKSNELLAYSYSEVVKQHSSPKEDPQKTLEMQVGSYIALLFAVDDYSKSVNDLEYPIKNAVEIQNVLENDFTFRKVEVFKNPSRANIVQILRSYQLQLTPQDHLLIFFAGHGKALEANSSLSSYWLPSDAEYGNPNTWISNSELVSLVEPMKAKHILIISDACFSGAIMTRDFLNTETIVCDELDSRSSRRILTSGSNEPVPDNSIFVKSFVQALRTTRSQCFTAGKLFETYMKDEIVKATGKVPQYASFTINSQGGEFVFRRR